MAVEKITLNLIPTGETPTIHAAQFDKEREFQIELKEGEDDFSPTGYDIELQVRKVDNNIVTAVPSQVSGNIVTFLTTEQMTACSGTNIAELQISKNNMSIATLHFYLVVQRDVLVGGVTSESDIYNLTEQIAAIVPGVIGDDYYNKEEVDEKIAEIPTFDPTNYYDKSDVNTLLNDKANTSDLSSVAFSGDYNDLENKPVLPDMSDYYTKTEVDNKITDLYQIKTASGSLIHITDGGDNIPLKSCEVTIEPDLSGKTECNLVVCGKNWLPLILADIKTANTSGTWSDNVYTINGAIFTVNIDSNGKVLSIKGKGNGNAGNAINLPFILKAGSYVLNSGFIENNGNNDTFVQSGGVTIARGNSGTPGQTFTLNSDSNCIWFFRMTSNTEIVCKPMIRLESETDATFAPYQATTYNIPFGQTVYGGHFDNKGNLVVTHGFIASYNGETINEPWESSMDNYVPNTLPSAGAQVVYPLTTPITLAITSQDISTLSGENNISSNTGDVEVEYFTEKSDGIAELIKAFM